MRLASALQRAWLGRGPLACALWPVSAVYGVLVGARRWLYRWGWFKSTRLSVPVIVVGNVVAGGAGKTPVVMAVVQHLQSQGWRPGVISRGYGRRTQDCREVLPTSPAADCGDEPLLIRQRCQVPVFVARHRPDAASALLARHPSVNIVVADDGLQHHALARDINIAVFDDRGTGNGWLLPAGPLREPWVPGKSSEQVQLVLHSGEHPAFAGFRSTRHLAHHGVTAQGERVALDALHGRQLLALAGIARPQQFFDMLRGQGLPLAHTLALPDHDELTDLAILDDPAVTVLCTEKDAVKLFARHPHAGERLLAVPLVFAPEPAFLAGLDRLLRATHPLPSTHGHTTS